MLQDREVREYRKGLSLRIIQALQLAVDSGKVRRIGRDVYEKLSN
ncbi:MAG: hypothetical protein QXS37_04960 [Candidatus Aenigmatarchaeota archaeon]